MTRFCLKHDEVIMKFVEIIIQCRAFVMLKTKGNTKVKKQKEEQGLSMKKPNNSRQQKSKASQ